MILALAVAALIGASTPPGVNCRHATSDALGVDAYTVFVDDGPPEIVLSQEVCRWLRQSRRSPEFAGGLLVLAHEAGHVVLDEYASESCVQRWARSHWRRLGQILGMRLPPTRAQVAFVRDLERALPAEYRGSCR